MDKGILLVISGFSGAGKGTVVKRLLEKDSNLWLSVSMTTRSPREGEKEGESYYFVSKEKFEDTIANDGLLEHASYADNYYGTPRKYVEDHMNSGKDVLLEIETKGALQVKKKFPDAVLVFITPPSAEELKRRLTGRGTETPEVINKRMGIAASEADLINEYDYLIVNDTVEQCCDDILELIKVSHNMPSARTDFIEKISKELKAICN